MLRLRGGISRGWQYRVSAETVDLVNRSDYMQAWWADPTQQSRPFFQTDTMLHISRLWRERFTGPDGQLQADHLSESFRSKDGMETDHMAYGLWVNTILDRPCFILRGDTVGIGGLTISEYCNRRSEDASATGLGFRDPSTTGGHFRYAAQEDWYAMGLYVDGTLLAEVAGQTLLSAGASTVIEVGIAKTLGIDQHKVCLEAVLDEHGRPHHDIPGLSLRSQVQFCVLCDNNVTLAQEMEDAMRSLDFLTKMEHEFRREFRLDSLTPPLSQHPTWGGGGGESGGAGGEWNSEKRGWGEGWSGAGVEEGRGGAEEGAAAAGLVAGHVCGAERAEGVAQVDKAEPPRGARGVLLAWKKGPTVDNPSFRCMVCEGAYREHRTVLDQSLVARAEQMLAAAAAASPASDSDKDASLAKISYKGGIPVEHRVRQQV